MQYYCCDACGAVPDRGVLEEIGHHYLCTECSILRANSGMRTFEWVQAAKQEFLARSNVTSWFMERERIRSSRGNPKGKKRKR